MEEAHSISDIVCMDLAAGDKVVEQGERIDGIYCIHSGSVALVKQRDDRRMIISVVKTGDLLGMPEMLSADTHPNGAVALEDTSACFIPKEIATELLKRNPVIMVRIMARVCERLRSMEQHAGT